MIAYIEGQIMLVESGSAVIHTGNVGYQVILSKKELDGLFIGQKSAFHIYTHIREDAFELFGFSKRSDKQIFQMLISVSGVGPKLALSMLSALSVGEIARALINKDLAMLSAVPGIGKKTAERLALELKDKALKLDLVGEEHQSSLVIQSLSQAIKSLGYSKDQSDKALALLHEQELSQLPLEDLIKKALVHLRGPKSL